MTSTYDITLHVSLNKDLFIQIATSVLAVPVNSYACSFLSIRKYAGIKIKMRCVCQLRRPTGVYTLNIIVKVKGEQGRLRRIRYAFALTFVFISLLVTFPYRGPYTRNPLLESKLNKNVSKTVIVYIQSLTGLSDPNKSLIFILPVPKL